MNDTLSQGFYFYFPTTFTQQFTFDVYYVKVLVKRDKSCWYSDVWSWKNIFPFIY